MALMYNDEKLVEECLKGKRKAQQLLYQRYAVRMLGVCMRYLKNRQDAEDALQSGFVKVFLKIDTFRKDGALESWIRKIMVNTALRKIKDEVRRKINSEEYLSSQPEECDEVREPGPFETLQSEDLYRMITALPDGYRTIFSLYAIDGHNHSEIASLLGISEGTSKSQLSRAREQLRKMIIAHHRNQQSGLKHA